MECRYVGRYYLFRNFLDPVEELYHPRFLLLSRLFFVAGRETSVQSDHRIVPWKSDAVQRQNAFSGNGFLLEQGGYGHLEAGLCQHPVALRAYEGFSSVAFDLCPRQAFGQRLVVQFGLWQIVGGIVSYRLPRKLECPCGKTSCRKLQG